MSAVSGHAPPILCMRFECDAHTLLVWGSIPARNWARAHAWQRGLYGHASILIFGRGRGSESASIPAAGRTRWAIFDPGAYAFYMNIADPAEIVVVDAQQPRSIARIFAIPSVGPHGLSIRTRSACSAPATLGN